MITLRTRRWRLALSASVTAGVGLLVLACEMPLPTVPRAAPEPEPAATAASQRLPADATEDSPAASVVERRESGDGAVRSEKGGGIRQDRSGILPLVERTQPEVWATGLSLDRAVWIAVDRDGVVQKSWIGPNLFINFDRGPSPNRVTRYPVGSAEWNRAAEDLERAGREEFRAHVPDMPAGGGSFAVWYHAGAGDTMLVVHVVTETAGMFGTEPLRFRW